MKAEELQAITLANPHQNFLANELLKKCKREAYMGYWGSYEYYLHQPTKTLYVYEALKDLLISKGYNVELEFREESNKDFSSVRVSVNWKEKNED